MKKHNLFGKEVVGYYGMWLVTGEDNLTLSQPQPCPPVSVFALPYCFPVSLSSPVSRSVLVSLIVSTCVLFVSVYLGSCFMSSVCLGINLCPCVYTGCSRLLSIKPFLFHNACRLSCTWVLLHLTT